MKQGGFFFFFEKRDLYCTKQNRNRNKTGVAKESTQTPNKRKTTKQPKRMKLELIPTMTARNESDPKAGQSHDRQHHQKILLFLSIHTTQNTAIIAVYTLSTYGRKYTSYCQHMQHYQHMEGNTQELLPTYAKLGSQWRKRLQPHIKLVLRNPMSSFSSFSPKLNEVFIKSDAYDSLVLCHLNEVENFANHKPYTAIEIPNVLITNQSLMIQPIRIPSH